MLRKAPGLNLTQDNACEATPGTGAVGVPAALGNWKIWVQRLNAFITQKGKKLIIINIVTSNKSSFSIEEIFPCAGSTEKTKEKALPSTTRPKTHLKTHHNITISPSSVL